jgi:V/A-type H+-transporting ATPase subunit E
MGLETVKKEILSNAKNEEKSILKDSDTKVKELLKSGEDRIKTFEAEYDLKTKDLVVSMEKKDISSAMLEAKKVLLNKKKDVIDKVKADVLKRVETLSEKDLKSLYSNAFDDASKEMKIEKVYCGSQMAEIAKKIGVIKVVHDELILGFVFENKDGSVRIDYSFTNIIEEIMDKELQEISALLF